MFNGMFEKLWEVKYFQEVADFKSLIMSNNLKKTFEESSKSRDIFRTQASIYDGVFREYN